MDYKITPQEKLKNLKPWEPEKTKDGYDLSIAAITDNPFQLTVSYKGSVGEIKKKLNFYLWTENFSKRNRVDLNIVSFRTVSAFEGFIKVMINKEEKLVKYRIIDANCNGCFNDYGKDYIYLDWDFDGNFKKKEAVPLFELFDFKLDKTTTQMRLIIPPFPAKIGIFPAMDNNFDTIKLEPQSDTE